MGKGGAKVLGALSSGLIGRGKPRERLASIMAGSTGANTLALFGGKTGENLWEEAQNLNNPGKMAGDMKAYLNPQLPKIKPDPQIKKDQAAEEARRRARRVGLALLMTSQQGGNTLGMG